MENELFFLGFVVFENPLKPETIPTMIKLNQANINSIIVTGDNALTAIKVA